MDSLRSNDSKEIVRALKLAIAQIELSIHDSDQAVLDLIGSIMSITGAVCQINTIVDEGGILSKDTQWPNNLKGKTAFIQNQIQQAVQAFQFYDRLSQRISHIEENLRAIADIMMKPDQQHPALWRDLEKKLSSIYSLEQEQTMYKALLHGISEAQVLEQPLLSDSDQKTGEIELF